ncbi:TetR/AcrR family transcriptional regulator C-terminal domain-containing protein [Cupriavidus agavae]|uniref:TetR/AcrR family transcriptional regulator C-terminal domain-containing protein n=1 Tax=Cupriavidus agavae TaxID=1001822 RepID=UPI001F283B7E|nr:TetR/AcrR family transcriptional regulator C-terminal domain-containing protein [Cupriavidus agavae]
MIDAALTLLEEEGLEGLTMRKLAQALQIQAPSLYWHFESKSALLDGMADALVESVAVTVADDNQPWDNRMRQIAGELRQALLKRRDGARVFAGTYVVTDNMLRISENMIDALVKAGFPSGRAATLSFSIAYYVLGFVTEEQALGPEGVPDLDTRKTAFFELAKLKYPQNWAARHAIFSEDFDGRFAVGLDTLLAGISTQIDHVAQHAKSKPSRSRTIASKAKAPHKAKA